MIREIKRKYAKIGTIISAAANSGEASKIELMNAFAGFVTIHNLEKAGEIQGGITYVRQAGVLKLKQAIGYHISQIRGDQIFALVLPSTNFAEDISRVYDFAAANRMERAYGFFLGNSDRPSVVAFTGVLAEHLFHAIPDKLEMVGDDWIKWVHDWAPKAMMTHRYFNGNPFCSISVPHIPDPAASAILLEENYVRNEALRAELLAANRPVVETGKRRPGRPKKK